MPLAQWVCPRPVTAPGARVVAARAPVGNGECAGHGGQRQSSLVHRLNDNGRRAVGMAALDDGGGVAVVADDGRGLL
jgi:hypothetical protein